MNSAHMLGQLIGTSERIGQATLAISDSAWVGASEVRFHVTLHLVMSIEQFVRVADAALESLC